jgi:uncharacterized membrane protein
VRLHLGLDRRETYVLGALIVLAAALRLPTLGLSSFWLDEAAAGIVVSQPSLGDVSEAIWKIEGNPPLYYVLDWAWAKVGGTGDVSLRLISAISGIATVPVVFAIGRRAVSSTTGLVAAALTATSPFLLYYSQENRPYALLVLLSALSLLFLQRLLADRATKDLVWWAVFAAAAMATHYFAVFLVVPEAILVLYRVGRSRRELLAVGGAGLVGLALLPLALHQSGDERTGWISTGLGERVREVMHQFAKGVVSTPGQGLGILAIALIVVGGLMLLRAEEERRKVLLLVGLAACTLGAPFVLALAGGSLDYFYYRYLIGAWVPLVVVLAAGFASRKAGRLGLVAAAALCAVWIAIGLWLTIDEDYRRGDWERAAKSLGTPAEARALVLEPGFVDGPLRRYGLDAVHSRGLITRQIVRVGLFPLDESPPSLLGAPQFRLVDKRMEQHISIAIYQAARPTPIGARALGITGAPGTPGFYAELPR